MSEIKVEVVLGHNSPYLMHCENVCGWTICITVNGHKYWMDTIFFNTEKANQEKVELEAKLKSPKQ